MLKLTFVLTMLNFMVARVEVCVADIFVGSDVEVDVCVGDVKAYVCLYRGL